MIQVQMAFWVFGSPRIDSLEIPRKVVDETKEEGFGTKDDVSPGGVVFPELEAAAGLTSFWDRGFTAFNVA